mgnify:CR=1 FL=1
MVRNEHSAQNYGFTLSNVEELDDILYFTETELVNACQNYLTVPLRRRFLD